jgi:hypothetical protein
VAAGVSEGTAVPGTFGDGLITRGEAGVWMGVEIGVSAGGGDGGVGERTKQPFLIKP